jgi:CheY-like chemotaxis protein
MELAEANDVTPKMLLVDDDPWILAVVSDWCTRVGFDVETAGTGLGALLNESRSKPDIIIIDVNIPELDGLSVCAQLLDGGTKSVRMIVVTGYDNPKIAKRCEALGAFYLVKGAAFWSKLETTLSALYPKQAIRILQSGMRSAGMELRRRPRVLLVDDDASVGKLFSSKLEKLGIEPLYAADANQGFRAACREYPTVIVSDYFMPDGDAEYFLNRLRSSPPTKNIPVIVQSGRDLSEIVKERLRRGALGLPGAARIVRKTFDTGDLLKSLQRYCCFEGPLEGNWRYPF